MPVIKPVSDLLNYNDVVKDIRPGEPVFLTRHGRGCYVLVDMQEYERSQAELRLLKELVAGARSGAEEGWLDVEAVAEEVRAGYSRKQ